MSHDDTGLSPACCSMVSWLVRLVVYRVLDKLVNTNRYSSPFSIIPYKVEVRRIYLPTHCQLGLLKGTNRDVVVRDGVVRDVVACNCFVDNTCIKNLTNIYCNVNRKSPICSW